MGIAVTSFVILFLLTEAILMARQWVLPLPVLLVAGAALAVASNWSLFRRD